MKTLFLGDVCPTAVNDRLFKIGDIPALFTDVPPIFKGNDINFVNLECALTENDKAIKKFGPALKATPNTANVLRAIGINCCGLSNNHFFDFGIRGAMDSLGHLENAGLSYTGFGENYEDSRKNLIIDKNGEKTAIITVCEHEYSYALPDRMGCRPFCEFDTLEDIRTAKEINDCVIVIYHGGKEHCRYPSPRLLKACRAMARSGADMVLCQHSHCIGCYEEYKGCHILYGQGNFHFVKPKSNSLPDSWNGCLAVSFDTKTKKIEFTPIVNTESGITLAKGEQKTEILKEFNERNKKLANGEWRNGWHEFCMSMKNNYLNAIKNAGTENATEFDNAFFAHYLDCEAHTDVWRELFPSYNLTNER